MYGLQFARSLLFLALAGGVRTYNVDERVRTVITSGLSASSVAEEFFGFSMDHHRYSDGSQAYVYVAISLTLAIVCINAFLRTLLN